MHVGWEGRAKSKHFFTITYRSCRYQNKRHQDKGFRPDTHLGALIITKQEKKKGKKSFLVFQEQKNIPLSLLDIILRLLLFVPFVPEARHHDDVYIPKQEFFNPALCICFEGVPSPASSHVTLFKVSGSGMTRKVVLLVRWLYM